MSLKIKTPAAIEPVSLSDALLHLRADSNTLAESLTMNQSIAPGAHTIAAAYSLEGTAVDVLGADVLVILDAGTCGAGGSVACKLQHRDDIADAWADVTGGAFTTVTEANNNAAAELAYTGGKKYIRPVVTVAGATCDFSVDVLEYSASVADSALITGLIIAAREWAEAFQNRQYITATWYLWLDDWPAEDFIKIPLPPLASITSITYYDTDDVAATFAATSYFVDSVSEPGRVCLNYGESWPSITLRPHNGICVEFVCGYGATAAAVPYKVKQAMLLHISKEYDYHSPADAEKIDQAIKALLWMDRIVSI